MGKLLLIDLPNLLMRNWHGAGLKTDADLPALIGNTRGTLVRLLDEEQPAHVVGTIDMPNCWRLDYHPEYKHGAGRADDRTVSPHHLVKLMIPTLVDDWGLCVAQGHRQEADDLNATLATQAEKAGMAVTVYTKDSDQVQLVSDLVTMRYPEKKGEPDSLYGPEKVRELYGVHPHQFPDLKTLLAYPKDNLRGVLGLSPGTRCAFTTKRALELLQLYPDFGHIFDARTLLPEKEREWLTTHEDGLAKLYAIAQLNRNANMVRSGPSGAHLLHLS